MLFRLFFPRLFVFPLLLVVSAPAASINVRELERAFARLTKDFDGRVGVCAQDEYGIACLNGDQRFSLQSVMKLIVAMAVMEKVDHPGWSLDEPIVVRKQDLSLYVQPIAKLVTAQGYQTTIGDLVRRAIVDSDSAAVDILIRKLGGPAKVQEFLDRAQVKGVRVDRTERDLQTEITGLKWKSEYLDPAALERAQKAVPRDVREAAFRKYQTDVRDTATPRGMTNLLQALAEHKILSAKSSQHLFDVMTQTVTFPGRLKAGFPAGWTLAHKTGTSGSWNGVTAATNDVGIAKGPKGIQLSIVVFIADSRASAEDRDALTAKLATAAVQHSDRPPMR